MIRWLQKVHDLLEKNQIILPTGEEPANQLVYIKSRKKLPKDLRNGRFLSNLNYFQQIYLSQLISEKIGVRYTLCPIQLIYDNFYSDKTLENLIKKGNTICGRELFEKGQGIYPNPTIFIKSWEDHLALYFGGKIKGKSKINFNSIYETLCGARVLKKSSKKFQDTVINNIRLHNPLVFRASWKEYAVSGAYKKLEFRGCSTNWSNVIEIKDVVTLINTNKNYDSEQIKKHTIDNRGNTRYTIRDREPGSELFKERTQASLTDF